MKIKKGDKVIVLSGKSRDARGKVARALPASGRLVVEGVNLAKRRQRPRKQGEKGQVVEVAMPLAVSNVALYCDQCGRGARVGYRLTAGKKSRICKRCSKEI